MNISSLMGAFCSNRRSKFILAGIFLALALLSQAAFAVDVSVVQYGKWRVEYDLGTGTANILFGGRAVVREAYAEVHLPEVVTSRDFKIHKMRQQRVHDGFGRGVELVVESSNGGDERMTQRFWLYKDRDYILTDVEISKAGGVASNFISPLMSQTASDYLPAGDDRALFVPFDNDMWVRYNAIPFGGAVTSYEVTALYDNTSRAGLVVGSVEHDVWKTGVVTETSSNAITGLEVFGGITSTNITHDVLPHGKVSGNTVRSPKIFLGCFADWRDGLETYAKANAIVAPPRYWTGGVPFGWNSWGKLQFSLNYDKAIQVSDFFARELPKFQNNGVTYIGLDAGWDALSDEQLKEFVRHCQTNHQKAGIYFTPFTAWGHDGEKQIAGTPWRYKDIYLYANGKTQTVDGGIALDPTHPGTQALIRNEVERFRRNGFSYIKADFMTHGALEADHHYDTNVTTGIEAYNAGMKFVDEVAGKDMYLNLSISPLFPAQYANSRRISCDTFGRFDQTEYMLNSLTYGWWLSKVYDFNDADHMVLGGFSEGENRMRVTSSAIAGIFISGDDLSDGGSAEGKQRVKEFLTNTDVCDVARIPKSFQPVEGVSNDHAANLFVYKNEKGWYLAAFNYSDTNADFTIEPGRIGLKAGSSWQAKELWSGVTQTVSGPWVIHLSSKDAALYKLQ